MKFIFVALLLIPGFAYSATAERSGDQKPLSKEEFRKLPADERRKRFAKFQEEHFGRIVRKEGSDKGIFKYISSQKKVPLKDIERPIVEISKALSINYAIEQGEAVTSIDAGDALKKYKASAAVFIVDDNQAPRLLVAPEEGWAIVNVARLNADSPDAQLLARRLRKEISRAFAYVAGAASVLANGAVMAPASTVADVDALPGDLIPHILFPKLRAQLKLFGIEPYVQTTYRKACEQGWAPEPQTPNEKAIWDEYHVLPQNPITIKPEPKR